MALLMALSTFFSTSAGGLFALRNKDRLHLVLGFSAGLILGVVAFDLLPEISRLAQQTAVPFQAPMIALAAGFLGFHIIEKAVLIHSAHEGEYGVHSHGHPSVGVASALALAGHSLTDGIAIGLAFQVSPTAGIGVALAVIGHDFADGLNTVGLLLANRNSRRQVFKYLALDALTPLVGAALTLFIHVPDSGLLIYLGVFAGFLLYIGASDVLPQAHAKRPSSGALTLTVAGAAAMYVVVGLLP
ncbi:ZIP family metal transporter [Paenarthrobacter sp. DKR-5]|uniref:ZIP family metal transporter n=1 Tax=Paenarthrobacter sp. DKR-5 TaxID=2835535 RepID=UPI001BDBC081|nr:ZIP family metal transporter [Paenarthrobacter sp. DKR-5]MBT1004192.1 ZIP family metal transporter [Paenarthrobacter sp. DKR-5]